MTALTGLCHMSNFDIMTVWELVKISLLYFAAHAHLICLAVQYIPMVMNDVVGHMR